MQSHLLVLGLIGFVCSSSAPACEFLAPLAGYEILRGESLVQFPNGTLSIPMMKASSGERRSLYSTDSELFYWNTVGEKKTYDKNQWGFFLASRTCSCMKSLSLNNPKSEFIRDQKEKACNELDCNLHTGMHSVFFKITTKECIILEINGHFLEFERIKEEMQVKEV